MAVLASEGLLPWLFPGAQNLLSPKLTQGQVHLVGVGMGADRQARGLLVAWVAL